MLKFLCLLSVILVVAYAYPAEEQPNDAGPSVPAQGLRDAAAVPEDLAGGDKQESLERSESAWGWGGWGRGYGGWGGYGWARPYWGGYYGSYWRPRYYGWW